MPISFAFLRWHDKFIAVVHPSTSFVENLVLNRTIIVAIRMVSFLFPLSRWKVDESCMLAIGSIQPLISEKVANGQLQFDIPRFLSEVVLPALDTSGKIFKELRRLSYTHCYF